MFQRFALRLFALLFVALALLGVYGWLFDGSIPAHKRQGGLSLAVCAGFAAYMFWKAGAED